MPPRMQQPLPLTTGLLLLLLLAVRRTRRRQPGATQKRRSTWCRALGWYTDVTARNYDRLNTSLRGGQGSRPSWLRSSVGHRAEHLDELLGSQEPLLEELRVYRGVDCDWIRHVAVGKEIADLAFMSTSERRSVAMTFALKDALFEEDRANTVLLDIIVPRGTRVLRVADLPEAVRGEQEVLFPRGTRLIIEGEAMLNNIRILQARVMQDEDKAPALRADARHPASIVACSVAFMTLLLALKIGNLRRRSASKAALAIV